MFLRPRWLKLLPKYVWPNESKIKHIEKLRKEFDIPHEMLAMRIANSRATTIKVQKHFLEEYRREFPNLSEKELWICVLTSRIDTYKQKIYEDASTGVITQKKAENKLDKLISLTEKAIKITESIKSFEELCDYIISLDEKFTGDNYSTYDPFDIGEMVDKILEE